MYHNTTIGQLRLNPEPRRVSALQSGAECVAIRCDGVNPSVLGLSDAVGHDDDGQLDDISRRSVQQWVQVRHWVLGVVRVATQVP